MRSTKAISELFILLGIFFLMSGVASLLAAGLVSAMIKVSPQKLTDVTDLQNMPYGRWWLLILQGISALGSFLGSFWLFRQFFEKGKKTISYHNKSLPIYAYIFFCTIIIMPFTAWVAEINQSLNLGTWAKEMELKLELLTKYLIAFDSFGQFMFGLFIIAVIPAIGEELFFRGLLQRKLTENINPHLAIWISAMIFSAVHLQFLGFFPRMFLGAMFGYFYYWSKDLKTAIFAHFINNGFTLLMVYLYHEKIVSVNISENPPIPLQMLLFSLLFAFFGMYQVFVRRIKEDEAI
jgi:membrane protease YdiL (CAAX protease family)